MTEPLVYTIEETAALLGIGRSSAYDAAHRGELPTVRLGRRLLVPRHALEQLLNVPATGTDSPQGNGAAGTAPQPGKEFSTNGNPTR